MESFINDNSLIKSSTKFTFQPKMHKAKIIIPMLIFLVLIGAFVIADILQQEVTSSTIDDGFFNFTYGYNSTTQRMTNWDGLNFKTNSNGVVTVRKGDAVLSNFGFALTGTVGGVSQNRTSQDFTWTWSMVQEGENYIFTAYNNYAPFNWTQKYYFYPNKSMKIKHILTNNLGQSVENTKMWYIHTIDEGKAISFNGTSYYLNLSKDRHLTGNFNSILPKVNFESNYFFNYSDLIDNGFDITNIFIGNGSIIKNPGVFIMAVGFTKGAGTFPDGFTIEIDPTIETVESTNNMGEYSSIALDSNGIAHISHYAAGDLRYCNNTGGSWNCEVADSGGAKIVGLETSLAIDSNDVVHISFHNHTGGDLRYCNNTGGSWNCEDIETTNDVGENTAIAIDTNDKVHISHYDNTNDDLRYCDNTGGSWACSIVDSDNKTTDAYTSIAINSSNVAHISYQHSSTNNPRHCHNAGGSWTCVDVEGTGSTGGRSSIAIDSNDVVHMSQRGNVGGDLRYCNNTGGSWNCELVLASSAWVTSIAIDSNDNPYITFVRSSDGTRLCKKISGWVCSNLSSAGTSGFVSSRSIAIKKGRIVDSTSFDTSFHISQRNTTSGDLIYITSALVELDVSISSPVNISYMSNNVSINLNFTINNETSLSQCLFSTDNFATNTTISGCTNTTFNRSDGNYLLKMWVNDSLNNVQTNSTNFTVDITTPLVDFAVGTETNNTNFSRDWIFVNVSTTEANFQNYTYKFYNDTLWNTTTYTSFTNTTNLTGLANDLYKYNVTIFDKASNSNSTITRWIRLDSTAPTINLVDPKNQVYSSNESIPLNYTVSDTLLSISQCFYQVWNTTAFEISNETLASCSNTTFNVSGDGTFNITLWSNDSLGNIGSSEVQFEVSTSAPAVVLDYPTSNLFLNNGTNVHFNYTATDATGLSQCQLWGNFTGTWHKNYTWGSGLTSGTQNFTKLNLSESKMIYNVWCNDTSNNGAFAIANLTFTIDETAPSIASPDITTVVASQDVGFNATITDDNINQCWYSVYNAAGAIDGSLENISYTCNQNDSFTVSTFANYKLRIYVNDSAGNANDLNTSFTVSATSSSSPGGGGTPVTPDTVVGFCGDDICQDGKNNRTDWGEDFFSCSADCAVSLSFEDINFETVFSNCWDGDSETPCIWATSPGLLWVFVFVGGIFIFTLFFEYAPKKKGIKRLVFVGRKKKRR